MARMGRVGVTNLKIKGKENNPKSNLPGCNCGTGARGDNVGEIWEGLKFWRISDDGVWIVINIIYD